MKFNPYILLAVFVIVGILINSSRAEYGEYNCSTDGGLGACQGCNPLVMCEKTKPDDCNKECYRACGFRTTYRSDKTTDYECSASGLPGFTTYTCKKKSAPTGEWCTGSYSNDECKKACKSTCEMNGQIYPLVDIVYGIAAGIAALMIILHGFKWLISEEPAERKEARERIIYVLYGLIIIIIAVALVNTIYSASISRCA